MINLFLRSTPETEVTDYESFLVNNRATINIYLNKALWFCVLTGPAIAIGVAFGVFKDVTYTTCFLLSFLTIILSMIHMLLLKQFPDSEITSVYSLLVLNAILVYMAFSHIYLRLTWFFIPLLALLFCSYRIYFIALFTNYALMVATTHFTAPYYASHRADYATSTAYFYNVFSGMTIETFIMAVAGIAMLRTTHGYLREVFAMYKTVRDREASATESMNILKSMAAIYDKVNLLNFRTMTEMQLSGKDPQKSVLNIDGCDHTSMVLDLRKLVAPDQIDSFWEFTNLTTLRERLLDKKMISGEFTNIISGWFRAQYIPVEKNSDGVPVKIIFTIQDIEKVKRKEEHLIRIAMTDELTHLYNRRSYDDDIAIYRNKPLEDNFTLLSADVNGLKITNDTKGHAAGDELIKGAADCLLSTTNKYGKVYRTGGDEFLAILHIEDYHDILNEIAEKTKVWHGVYTDSISISIGCASHNEFPDATVDDLERISDRRMYEAKELYYTQANIDRRRK